jgi:hypothetical protein
MRDKNLTLSQFNIQLEKAIFRGFPLEDQSSRSHVLDTPTRQPSTEVLIKYPRDYRLLRSLAIAQWYFPESLHWRVFLDLDEMSFSQLNEKQKLEIKLLLTSKEIMETFLYETQRYSPGEIFGNILGNDLKDLQKVFKVSRKSLKSPKKKVRRRGYQDHGSKRPDHLWLPSFDSTLTELMNEKEKKSYLLLRSLDRLRRSLELSIQSNKTAENSSSEVNEL